MIDFTKYIIQIGIGFYLTNIVGQKIASSYQRKNALELIKRKKAEAEIDSIQSVLLSLITASSERRFAATDLITALTDKPRNDDKIIELRKKNKIKVNEWNINLGILNMKMFNLDLYELSIEIENTIHSEFRKSHSEINSYLDDDDSEHLLKATVHLENVYHNSRKISNRLSIISKDRWEKLTSDNTEQLDLYNLHNASNYVLLKSILNFPKNTLRVPRT
ncbi:hypothetical protein [Morganella morganii]|uniref:hypothetical protein n=1 Tax=Morganella morganii TaxID=582 RepID=UPI001BDAADE7|nr:hypothetical protein [Morganella morganii]ELT0453078.1 hypothetical protein [Morganella morganii]MBT0336082.1 hypothetical protein [Morganella morganii subsp. morganii]